MTSESQHSFASRSTICCVNNWNRHSLRHIFELRAPRPQHSGRDQLQRRNRTAEKQCMGNRVTWSDCNLKINFSSLILPIFPLRYTFSRCILAPRMFLLRSDLSNRLQKAKIIEIVKFNALSRTHATGNFFVHSMFIHPPVDDVVSMAMQSPKSSRGNHENAPYSRISFKHCMILLVAYFLAI